MLNRNASGAWKETRAAFFAPPGIYDPTVAPIAGKGALKYDILGCGEGGDPFFQSQGVVYRLSPPADGTSKWTQTILYSFGGKPNDPNYNGIEGSCGLAEGDDGKLFGTTAYGGANRNGAFFELDPPAPGSSVWTETVLYSFLANRDGYKPYGAPLRRGKKYYGTVSATLNGFGGVYEITP